MVVVLLVAVALATRTGQSLLLDQPVSSQSSCIRPTLDGCFGDPYAIPGGGTRAVLTHLVTSNDANLTADSCIAACCGKGYGAGALAGVENGTECYCDDSFGPYTPPKSTSCVLPCSGNRSKTCGGQGAIEVYTIATCSGNAAAAATPLWATSQPLPPDMKTCGAEGCTKCLAGDACCVGKSPDSYKVPGGYGCAPPNSANTSGCASGAVGDWGCCCGPGPSVISSTKPNVLIVGDSVSEGYTPFVMSALPNVNFGHGPDNTGGGAADGVGYGQLCMKYFVRTPQHELPPWDLITFNFGLHDGADTNESYYSGLTSIADQLVETAKSVGTKPAKLIYFQTTIPGGANSVPGEPVSPNDRRVMQLNAIAAQIMKVRNITTIDLYETMVKCGKTCSQCKPHCPPAGYQYLVDNAIVPAIKKALDE